jgi:hypothetical protein
MWTISFDLDFYLFFEWEDIALNKFFLRRKSMRMSCMLLTEAWFVSSPELEINSQFCPFFCVIH